MPRFGSLPRVPLLFAAVMTVVPLIVGEEYPFSPFPMYDNFPAEAAVYWVSDAQDQPIAVQNVFGHRASTVKKIYENRLKAKRSKSGKATKLADLGPEVEAAAATETLEWLRSNSTRPNLPPVIRLHRNTLRLRDGSVTSTPAFLAELK